MFPYRRISSAVPVDNHATDLLGLTLKLEGIVDGTTRKPSKRDLSLVHG